MSSAVPLVLRGAQRGGGEKEQAEAEEQQAPQEETEENKQEGSDTWRRLKKTDKERYLDDFELEVEGKKLVIHQGLANSVEIVGLTVWDSSIVLSKFLEHRKSQDPSSVVGKRIIEVGGGCGVLSLSAAVLGANVIGTDCKWIVPLMKLNAQKNASLITDGQLVVQELFWGNESDYKGLGHFDMVLAADTVYLDKKVPDLLATIWALADEDTEILFGFQEHNPESVRVFWSLVYNYFSGDRVCSKCTSCNS
ncbi:hypothetical protein QOT17_005599 [Balamuthia mandrillaris]